MTSALSRRSFLARAAAVAAAPLILPARALGRAGSPAPSNRLGLGVIGLGDRGSGHLATLLGDPAVRVAAVCDVFRGRAGASAARAGQGCTAYQDFRELLARPDVDAVFIAAPENWHAIISIEAMKAGKDVYCEKALSLTVAEGRAVCEAVRRTGRVFQAGTQQRSDGRFRLACELARNGYLGKLHTVSVSVPSGRRELHLKPGTPPADLDYNLWLGPAPFKPYREGLCNYNWYFHTDYCAGWIQSWGVHHMDIALWGAPALQAATLTVEGTADFLPAGDADVSFGWKTVFTTPDGLTMRFYDDGSSPLGHGVRFEGTDGWVHVDRSRLFASSPALLETVLRPAEEHLYVSRNHHGNFLECIRTRRDPVAPVEACHAATTATLVADIATRTGRKLTWDWKTERFLNDDGANRMLSRSLRSPWHV